MVPHKPTVPPGIWRHVARVPILERDRTFPNSHEVARKRGNFPERQEVDIRRTARLSQPVSYGEVTEHWGEATEEFEHGSQGTIVAVELRDAVRVL
jgi:hypothetical protein